MSVGSYEYWLKIWKEQQGSLSNGEMLAAAVDFCLTTYGLKGPERLKWIRSAHKVYEEQGKA
ncbi:MULTISPECIES: hypothetical protein [Paenibacillus]|uniref:Uncharacterized protein n=1 Tax=Paenibacillus odorifer TaxID=189426 RepID=A0AB36J571_9BACL|nr:hypothetical protein [Paenibacillus odorifer]OMD10601.1 hypothetical protein BJP50_28210 [Paenibacillus odorifer]OME07450.1 hypothetical protein BSK60_31500 [Paenibacillus odorifer]OME10261.1 hypothetical protein BSK47_31060 [Paenibacillus odorifer]